MEFKAFKLALKKNFEKITKSANVIFEVDLDKDELWNVYLDSFPEGTNKLFRERREHDCSSCRHFVKSVGSVVVIKDAKMKTIWDFDAGCEKYQTVINALNEFVRSKIVKDVFLSPVKNIGTDVNYELLDTGKTLEWQHMYIELSDRFVNHSYKTIPDIQGDYRSCKNVFKRSLDEITLDSINTVLELINSNTLYRGSEWKEILKSFRTHKIAYSKLSDKEKDLYSWEQSVISGPAMSKIRNHSIGTLLVDISNEVDLEVAVRKYEAIVAPSNYKRPNAIFTKKMLEDAKKAITDMGYMDSLARRHATLDDISINNILFSDRDAQKRMKDTVDVFDDLMSTVTKKPKKFNKVEEISIEKFLTDVLPSANSVEAYFENKLAAHLVSLIAPQNIDSKHMFKWDNNFSWAYSGNIADSAIKNNVKAAGGSVTGVLRFSIQWNESGDDNCDLDAHCREPNNHEIYFSTDKKPRRSSMDGQLDIDIINPHGEVAVENITWPNKNRMKAGDYKFFVHQYSGAAKHGFRAEIEADGEIFTFEYNHAMREDQRVPVATVSMDANGNFTVHPEKNIDSNTVSRTIWGLNTNEFVPVSVIMFSPNYWDEQNGIGNKHYMFMLKGCVNDESPNGFYNEYLKSELDKHKRVFEALGNKMAVAVVDDQLSGLGFSSTKRSELVVKVSGSVERIMKIKF